MKRIVNALVALSVILLATTGSATTPQSIEVTRNLTSMPLAFTENQGQWDDKVQFRANAGGATMWFASDGAFYQFTRTIESDPISVVDKRYGMPDDVTLSGVEGRHHQPDSIETMMIKASFVGANHGVEIKGTGAMEYKCNYFIGNDPNEWHTDVPNYQAIVYEDIYSGIDLKYYGNGKQMEYDFIVSPGADPSQITVSYDGATSVAVNEAGELVVETDWGRVVEHRPLVYQEDDGIRTAIECEYALINDNTFSFCLPHGYERELTLVIDPVLSYSTYLGGIGYDVGEFLAVDVSGAVYVTGSTVSPDFPTENPYQTDQAFSDIFVTKLSNSGSSLVYSTYLGGSGYEAGLGLAVNDSGAVYVTGNTSSTDFPTENPYQMNYGGSSWDVFVSKLSSSGNSLIYSTYLGGGASDWGDAIAVDAFGAAYVTGYTQSANFPTENPYQTDQPGEDAFVTKLSGSGSNLVYSTYLGGNDIDQGRGIAVDGSGAAYVTGSTGSTDFPTENPYQTYQGGWDIIIAKLSSSGNSLVYSTYLGGGSEDRAFGIAVDGSGAAYVTGFTNSPDFPTENPYQTDQAGRDVIIAKLSSSGDSLVYSTYLGGNDSEVGWGIAVDGSGAAYVTGSTESTDFPTESPFQTDQGGLDVFVTKLNSFGSSLIYSTYLGGNNQDGAVSIAVDGSMAAYVTGGTTSSDFPTEGPYQPDHVGVYNDAFVTKFSGECCIPPIRGNVDYDVGDAIDISDLVYLVDYMFTSGPAPVCWEEANIDGSGPATPPDEGVDDIDISDLVYLVDYMFNQGPPPVACP